MADYRIDSHKLIFHPHQVAKWLDGENIYPIYMEVTPTGSCNHRCIFCALDYMDYKANYLDKEAFLYNLSIMRTKGVKSIMFAGEGEPLLNVNTPEFVLRTKEAGIDTAMTTNGVLLKPETISQCLHAFSWIRISLNAGTTATYDKIHRGKQGDFERVLDNLYYAVAHKKKHQLSTTIGVQLLLIPENQDEVLKLAEKVAEIGVDYFSVKPFSQHPMSICQRNDDFNDKKIDAINNELQEKYGKIIHIAFRSNAMNKLKHDRLYSSCLGLPFWAYIDSQAQVWACSAYLGDNRFLYGDLKVENFEQIWEGHKRREVLNYVSSMDIKKCREICRLDEINIYLSQLKNPSSHINFI